MSVTMEDLTLLVVEPSQVQHKIMVKRLETLGVRHIARVATMDEALTYIRAASPHAVLSAMHLPDGKGHELLMAIRNDEAIADVVFMLISSETRTVELEPIRQGGAIAIIPKPFSQADLARALGDTLDLLSKESLEIGDQDIEDVRALVVDDSRTARRYIAKVLGQLGIESIVQAGDGVEAAQCLAEAFFDLVVTDYNMPNMNGHELVEHIRQESTQPTVPVLMVTSEKNGARVAGVERAGVSAIVDKPFEIERVRMILQNLLS